jgi:hypothetical protein
MAEGADREGALVTTQPANDPMTVAVELAGRIDGIADAAG